MKPLLRKLPLPISGLMLGLAALGNLLGAYHSGLRYFLGSLSALLFIGLLLKIIAFPGCIKEGFTNPVVACIMATFPMALMLLTTYIKPYAPSLAFTAWALAIGLNIVLLILFTKTYLFPFNIKKVFSSYFVLYVGIVVASVTSPLYNMQALGQAIFWFGLLVYIPLVPLVSYRVFKVGQVPEPAQPVIIIYAAPASLLLAGYLNSFPVKNTPLVVALGAWAFAMTLYGLSQMPRMLKLPFYPSYSAFTFPFVISAIAFNGMVNYLTGVGYQVTFLRPVVTFQIVWATLMVVYVLVRYALFLNPVPATSETNPKRVS